MSSLENQLDVIEKAMSLFFSSIKQPAYWSKVASLINENIDRPTAAILQSLAHSQNSECQVQELALSLRIEAPSVTRKTQELETEGLVKRSHSSVDRRIVIVKLTDKGQDLANKIRKAQRQVLSQSLDNWDTNERQAFSELFDKFSRSFSEINKLK
jgi:DNA-binding MarR family transcriptional regulator